MIHQHLAATKVKGTMQWRPDMDSWEQTDEDGKYVKHIMPSASHPRPKNPHAVAPEADWKIVTKAKGLIPKFHTGGIVPNFNKEQPAMLLGGEGVVNQKGMETLGRSGLNELNQGSIPNFVEGKPNLKDWSSMNVHLTTRENLPGIKAKGLQPQSFHAQGPQTYFMQAHPKEDWDELHKGDLNWIVSTTKGGGKRLDQQVGTKEGTDKIAAGRKMKKVALGFPKGLVGSEEDPTMKGFMEQAAMERYNEMEDEPDDFDYDNFEDKFLQRARMTSDVILPDKIFAWQGDQTGQWQSLKDFKSKGLIPNFKAEDKWKNVKRDRGPVKGQAEAARELLKREDIEEGKPRRLLGADLYQKITDELMPLKTQGLLKIPTRKELEYSLTDNKTSKIGILDRIEGDDISARLDIPSTYKGAPAITVHDPPRDKEGKPVKGINPGNVLSYEGIVSLTNPEFYAHQDSALQIAQRQTKRGKPRSKIAMATVHGKLGKKLNAEQAASRYKWPEVGFNPARHSYFYDKSNQEPVVKGTEAMMLGHSVHTKGLKYGNKQDFLYNEGLIPNFAKMVLGTGRYSEVTADTKDKNQRRVTKDIKPIIG
jgi:hypothetical protein